MLHLLLQLPEYQQAAERLVVEHLSGEGKVGADLLIRGLWERFHAFVEVMRVKPIRLPLTALERDFVTQVLEEAASHKGTLLDARVLSSTLDDGRRRAAGLGSYPAHRRQFARFRPRKKPQPTGTGAWQKTTGQRRRRRALLPAVHHPG